MKDRFRYQISEEMQSVLDKAGYLNDYAAWFNIAGASFDVERRMGDLGRLLHYLPEHLAAVDEQQLIAYVNAADEEITIEARRLLNIRKALQFCRVVEEPYGIPLLQKIHNILLNNLPEAGQAGRLRESRDTLSAAYPPPAELDAFQEEFKYLAVNRSIHPILRSWLLYYFLISIHFFEAENDTLAVIFCYYFLHKEGYGFNHLLKLEKYVLHSKKYMAYSINYIENKGYVRRFSQDLSSYLQICLQGFTQNLEFVEDMYRNAVKRQMEYGILTPRQKNSVNYWLESGYQQHKSSLASFNKRQKELLVLLYSHTELSTADAAALYNTDRKTIQDDFTKFMECGIATLKGSGRNTRYILNFL